MTMVTDDDTLIDDDKNNDGYGQVTDRQDYFNNRDDQDNCKTKKCNHFPF